MERLTTRNIAGVAVYKNPFECDRCGDTIWRLSDYGDGSPTEKLANYEDAEEHGLLLRLPCRVGDTIYSIANDNKIYPVKATREVRIVNGVLHIICESCRYSDLVSYDDVGKTVFLTQAEAEQKLKGMERD